MKIEFNDENKARIARVAENLRGTCGVLDDAFVEEFGEDASVSDADILLLHELDGIVMQCEGCGWWCETSDMNDDLVCADCADQD